MNKVDKKIRYLENKRDKLITQLFQELQSVKRKLNECIASKADLQKEILAYKLHIEESKLTAVQNKLLIQKVEESKVIVEANKALTKQNNDHVEEKRNLQKKVEMPTSSLLHAQMYSNYVKHNFKVQKYILLLGEMQKRLSLAEAETQDLRRHKEMLEKHVPQETLSKVKGNK